VAGISTVNTVSQFYREVTYVNIKLLAVEGAAFHIVKLFCFSCLSYVLHTQAQNKLRIIMIMIINI
jgi:hypothetical protein